LICLFQEKLFLQIDIKHLMECLQTLNVNLFGKHCAAAQSTFSKGLAFWIFGT